MARASRGGNPPEGLEVCAVADSDEFIVVTWDVSGEVSPSPVSLTPAERAVLSLLIAGDSNAAIARERKTSVRTVANQVASLLAKLQAGSRYDLIRRFGAPRAPAR